jgi:hypothetical protein
MKNTSLRLVALTALLLITLAMPALATNKEVTITGDGKCAKCALHLSDTCQNVIQTQEDGKTVTYWLAQNKVSKDFHENLCKESRKVTATGTVTEEDGKKVLTASKIELAK